MAAACLTIATQKCLKFRVIQLLELWLEFICFEKPEYKQNVVTLCKKCGILQHGNLSPKRRILCSRIFLLDKTKQTFIINGWIMETVCRKSYLTNLIIMIFLKKFGCHYSRLEKEGLRVLVNVLFGSTEWFVMCCKEKLARILQRFCTVFCFFTSFFIFYGDDINLIFECRVVELYWWTRIGTPRQNRPLIFFHSTQENCHEYLSRILLEKSNYIFKIQFYVPFLEGKQMIYLIF